MLHGYYTRLSSSSYLYSFSIILKCYSQSFNSINRVLDGFLKLLRATSNAMLTAKLVDFVGGWLTWQLFPKPIAKEGVAAQRASPIALLFEGKQPCFSSDATAGGLQQLPKFTQSPTVDPFFLSLFKITSSEVAYFSWKKINSFMLSFDMQGNMNFQFSQWYEILNFLDQIKNTTSISKIVLFSYILFSWIKKWNYYLVKVY